MLLPSVPVRRVKDHQETGFLEMFEVTSFNLIQKYKGEAVIQDTKIAVGSLYKSWRCRTEFSCWNGFCSFLDPRTKVPELMCALAGRWAEALDILERMPQELRDLVSFSDT